MSEDDELEERIVAAAPVGIGLLDSELRYLHVNDALAEMHGTPAEDHIGRGHGDVSPATAGTVEPVLRAVLTSGEPRQAIESGHRKTLLSTSFPVDGGVGRVVVDLTPHLDTLCRTNQLAHDLRSPLGAIDTAATLLVPAVAADARARQHLAVLQRASGRMQQLITDLSEADQIRRGTLQLERSRERVADLIADAIALVADEASAKVVSIDNRTGDETVDVDRKRIVPALRHLLSAAIRASGRGSTVTVRVDGGAIAIADVARPTGHPPLGVLVARDIIEGHGGALRIDATEVGTTSYVTLA